MRHLNSGSKLGRNPAHRRATLRNLVTNVIEKERITTTVTRAKSARRLVEQMITLGKRDSLHARRQAAAFLMTPGGHPKTVQRHRSALCGPLRRLHAHHPRRFPHRRRRATRDPRNPRLQAAEKRQEGKRSGRRKKNRPRPKPSPKRFGSDNVQRRPALPRAGFFFCVAKHPGKHAGTKRQDNARWLRSNGARAGGVVVGLLLLPAEGDRTGRKTHGRACGVQQRIPAEELRPGTNDWCNSSVAEYPAAIRSASSAQRNFHPRSGPRMATSSSQPKTKYSVRCARLAG